MITMGLQPNRVWYYFEQISLIPRESGDERAVSDYIIQTIESFGLNVIQDEMLNVIAYKEASQDKINAPSVLLQGHMDMVCVKDDNYMHDFAVDPIKLLVEDGYITAEHTTLGADNGMAVAMMLAVLEDASLSHPRLTCLFTVEEETTMKGAENFDANLIDCSVVINLDSEEEGVALASNAGGESLDVALPIEWREAPFSKAYKLTICGLKGGHSGSEINQNRASAIKLLGRLISGLDSDKITIFKAEGGQKMNAIAKSAVCYVNTDYSVDEMLQLLTPIESQFKNEFQISEPSLSIAFEKTSMPNRVYAASTQQRLSDLICLIPQSVQTMSQGIEGLVESSNNMGVLRQQDDMLLIGNAIRSSVKSIQDQLAYTIQTATTLVGGTSKRYDSYPAWPYKTESKIRNLLCSAYQQLTGKEMKIEAVHAGLECGVLAQKLGDVDMISIGPQMYDAHTPRERVSIDSTESTYKLVLKVLSDIE